MNPIPPQDDEQDPLSPDALKEAEYWGYDPFDDDLFEDDDYEEEDA